MRSTDRAILQRSPGDVSAAHRNWEQRLVYLHEYRGRFGMNQTSCRLDVPAAVSPGHPSMPRPAAPSSAGGAVGSAQAMSARTPGPARPRLLTRRLARRGPRAHQGRGRGQGAAASPRKWTAMTGTRCPRPQARPRGGSRGRCHPGHSPAARYDILLPLKATRLRVLKCWTPAF